MQFIYKEDKLIEILMNLEEMKIVEMFIANRKIKDDKGL